MRMRISTNANRPAGARASVREDRRVSAAALRPSQGPLVHRRRPRRRPLAHARARNPDTQVRVGAAPARRARARMGGTNVTELQGSEGWVEGRRRERALQQKRFSRSIVPRLFACECESLLANVSALSSACRPLFNAACVHAFCEMIVHPAFPSVTFKRWSKALSFAHHVRSRQRTRTH
eukprot:6213220-Pleurochrysis_carterae.AAC.1